MNVDVDSVKADSNSKIKPKESMTKIRESAIKIGRPTPLTTIISESKDFNKTKPAVLILNSGVMHHIGTCRVSVKIARLLAETGFLAARFDFSGIGDSETRRGTQSFQESSVAETKEVMDYLQRKKGINQFIVYGLCSGADASYEVALRDERVIGMVQIDSYCYRNWRWYLTHYGPRILDIEVWKRLFHRVVGTSKAPTEGSTASLDDEFVEMPSYIRVFPPKQEIAKGLATLAAKKIHMYNIFTGGALDVYNHDSQFESSFSKVDFKGLLRVDYYSSLEHIITDPEYQKLIPQKICQWVQIVADAHQES